MIFKSNSKELLQSTILIHNFVVAQQEAIWTVHPYRLGGAAFHVTSESTQNSSNSCFKYEKMTKLI